MRTFTHSLLDRLLDDDPAQAVEATESEEAMLEHYKASLRRDLEKLLNSRRPLLDGLDRYEELDATIIGYGVHDISTEDFSTAAVRDRMRRMIAKVIRTHETRLSNIEVELDDAPTSRGMRLRIAAVLTLTRNRDLVIYEASVRPGERTIAVDLSS